MEENPSLRIENVFDTKQKEILQNAQAITKEYVEREMKLFEFEILYSCMVDKNKIENTEKEITKLKNKRWTKALKLAKGNEGKAMIIYDDIEA